MEGRDLCFLSYCTHYLHSSHLHWIKVSLFSIMLALLRSPRALWNTVIGSNVSSLDVHSRPGKILCLSWWSTEYSLFWKAYNILDTTPLFILLLSLECPTHLPSLCISLNYTLLQVQIRFHCLQNYSLITHPWYYSSALINLNTSIWH